MAAPGKAWRGHYVRASRCCKRTLALEGNLPIELGL